MQSGAIRLFKFAGIQVSLHFSWFLMAVYMISRPHGYHSPIFAVYQYLGLFCIVLLHEFGHAFACRQTGGIANYILLWPFGGFAFVQPPPRPGAQLWSIAAGPLVNVALIPIFALLGLVLEPRLAYTAPDFARLIGQIAQINLIILVFNLLPIYPLDGGQILRSLLWFPLGPIASLQVASAVGLVGGALLGIYGLLSGSLWVAFIAFFLVSQAMTGWRHAKQLRLEEESLVRPEAPRPPML
jgi:Zn-dependent protease